MQRVKLFLKRTDFSRIMTGDDRVSLLSNEQGGVNVSGIYSLTFCPAIQYDQRAFAVHKFKGVFNEKRMPLSYCADVQTCLGGSYSSRVPILAFCVMIFLFYLQTANPILIQNQ